MICLKFIHLLFVTQRILKWKEKKADVCIISTSKRMICITCEISSESNSKASILSWLFTSNKILNLNIIKTIEFNNYLSFTKTAVIQYSNNSLYCLFEVNMGLQIRSLLCDLNISSAMKELYNSTSTPASINDDDTNFNFIKSTTSSIFDNHIYIINITIINDNLCNNIQHIHHNLADLIYLTYTNDNLKDSWDITTNKDYDNGDIMKHTPKYQVATNVVNVNHHLNYNNTIADVNTIDTHTHENVLDLTNDYAATRSTTSIQNEFNNATNNADLLGDEHIVSSLLTNYFNIQVLWSTIKINKLSVINNTIVLETIDKIDYVLQLFNSSADSNLIYARSNYNGEIFIYIENSSDLINKLSKAAIKTYISNITTTISVNTLNNDLNLFSHSDNTHEKQVEVEKNTAFINYNTFSTTKIYCKIMTINYISLEILIKAYSKLIMLSNVIQLLYGIANNLISMQLTCIDTNKFQAYLECNIFRNKRNRSLTLIFGIFLGSIASFFLNGLKRYKHKKKKKKNQIFFMISFIYNVYEMIFKICTFDIKDKDIFI